MLRREKGKGNHERDHRSRRLDKLFERVHLAIGIFYSACGWPRRIARLCRRDCLKERGAVISAMREELESNHGEQILLLD